MGSRDLDDIICAAKHLNDVATEQISGTTRAQTPALDFLGVTPHQVTHCSVVRHFLLSVDRLYLIQCVEGWGQTAVNAENFVVYDGCEWKEIEYFSAIAPYVD